MKEEERFPSGESPYAVLKEAGITPESTMMEIQQAMQVLIERGLRTPETRAAWDTLRLVERRLWVDLLSFPELQIEFGAESSGDVARGREDPGGKESHDV